MEDKAKKGRQSKRQEISCKFWEVYNSLYWYMSNHSHLYGPPLPHVPLLAVVSLYNRMTCSPMLKGVFKLVNYLFHFFGGPH